MLSSARFRAVVDTQSFLNLKFGMTLSHLKIEKYRLERARPVGGVDLVLTEWTPVFFLVPYRVLKKINSTFGNFGKVLFVTKVLIFFSTFGEY